MLLCGASAAIDASVTVDPAAGPPSPSPSPSRVAGPCQDPPLSAITERPAIGRASATSGSVCVAPRNTVVLEVGYRNQETTAAARQTLVTYPQPVVLFGLGSNNELILAPSLSYARRSGNANAGLSPASGLQDAGLGFQRTLFNGSVFQTGAQAFITIPTGYPTGASGFSAGVPTFQLTYSIAYAATPRLGITSVSTLLNSSGAAPSGVIGRYAGIQEALGLAFTLLPATVFLMQDQVSAPGGPHAPTGNRLLIGVQQVITSHFVADLDYEANLLPAPGISQHTTFEFGLSLQL